MQTENNTKIAIKDGNASRTYRQSKMCKRLFGWYAPEEMTKAEASAFIERGLSAQKDKTYKVTRSIKENSHLIRLNTNMLTPASRTGALF